MPPKLSRNEHSTNRFALSSLLQTLVIVAAAGVILYVGYRAQKRVRNQSDYFLGGRRFGKAIQTFAAFGQGTSVESVTVTTTMVAANA